jgi:hypothetical protein
MYSYASCNVRLRSVVPDAAQRHLYLFSFRRSVLVSFAFPQAQYMANISAFKGKYVFHTVFIEFTVQKGKIMVHIYRH